MMKPMINDKANTPCLNFSYSRGRCCDNLRINDLVGKKNSA